MEERPDPSTRVEVSVIVPAFREAGNVDALTRRIFAATEKAGLKGAVEMIIVDDNSRDGTEEKCAALRAAGYPLRLIVRKDERGLSSAVLRGFDEAVGYVLLCMDADLQHPPEKVPDLVAALRDGSKPAAEFVLGTRFRGSGSIDKDWPLYRQVISWGARKLARPLTPMSDPVSGFFGLTRGAYARARKGASPLGYKIALELYVKAGIPAGALREVPFDFGTRAEGESKLTGKVIVHYAQHLVKLYSYCYGTALAALAAVAALLLLFALRGG